ncbi:putative 3-hydroxybutyryl-CoA dehydrogenase [Novipirellula galeiformis]|uniref:Putative 3-hydroxybutyryl-CoA dehydrogenase n=1 Tax=Novipirellula galeiformis TaxID=2528004 RepID=A0A5C6CM41_9BACT|nr:3-hydroxyacyl-CoA dehydrogenase family protein [Novipirellula galeiformis]TWU25422.1 putative 3-hydroxybutyryl-CoA dehydrogenase [Novipirellula galeiformis]
MNVQLVGVIGLGLMGRGICAALLSRGIPVIAFDTRTDITTEVESHIETALREMKNSAHWRNHFHWASTLEALADCDYVVESLPEDLQLKQRVLKELESLVPVTTPIASNTSALPITVIQQPLENPERVIGMHWAEPCHLTRFLEVIRGEQTNDATTDITMELGKRLGKDPSLVRRDVPGFIVNRLAYAMYREAFWLLENGVADIETIDRSFVNAISVWADVAGPFRWMDLTGLAAYAEVMKRLFPELSQATQPPQLIQDLVQQGACGAASGQGFYSYGPGEAAHWANKLQENVKRVQPHLGHAENSNVVEN